VPRSENQIGAKRGLVGVVHACEAGDLADPPHVLGSISGAEPEIGVETMTQIVAIEQVCRVISQDQPPFPLLMA
jgi:hypothetical protein